jgi:NADH-quinone oxidoreductase subunit N
MTPTDATLALVAPELIVVVTALVVLMADLWLPAGRRDLLIGAALVGLLAAGVAVALAPPGVAFAGLYVRDGLTRAAQGLAVAVTALGVMMAPEYLRRHHLERGEYYMLVLTAGVGAMLMAASRDLLMLFLALETLSIPLYVLAATGRANARAQEAGMKYFLLGAFASAFLLYGVALLYGATGTTRLPEIGRALAQAAAGTGAAAGVGLLTIGLAFKAALVPFHTWAPDVYDGAPMPAAAFLAVIAKVGAFAALLRVFPLTMSALAVQWSLMLGGLAAVTMIVANLAALAQTSYKRLLAYSSIAHTGYAMIGVATGTPDAVSAVMSYLVVYAAMTLGAFAVAVALERAGQEADRIEDYAGLATRAPLLAAASAAFMISLAGLPPTGGFMVKLRVFATAIESGGPVGLGLAIVGVATSVVSVYYYLRVPYIMYAGDPPTAVRLHPSPLLNVAVLVAAVAVLQTGILPAAVTAFAQQVGALVGRP